MKKVFKGSWTETGELKPMIKYDIIQSNIEDKVYRENTLTVNNDGNIFMYHFYNNGDCWGRWYNNNVQLSDYLLDEENHMFTYLLEDTESGRTMNVNIYFTPKGYKKFLKYLIL